MYPEITFRSAALAFGILVFAGCAANQSRTDDVASATETVSSSASTSASVQTSSAAAAAAAAAAANEARVAQARQAAAAAAVANPTIVSFEKMSTALDDKNRQTVAQTTDRAKISKKVIITGFCDGQQIGNPIDAAVARAISVRDELVARGVTPSLMTVKFSTKVAKKHAAEIRFD